MINIKDEDLIFYDIEVFAEDAFVVFKDINYEVVGIFHNVFDNMWDIIEGKTLVGFNNYYYDDKIITQMLQLKTPRQLKSLNDRIIIKKHRMPTDMRLRTLDVFQQMSVSRSGLKKVEGNMGKMILESTVGFDIDRALTDDEYQVELDYCKYDVDMVIDIWKMRKKEYFEPKLMLLKRYDNPNAYRWNTTTISANMLLDKPLPMWSTHRVPEDLMNLVPPEVVDLWDQVNDIGGKPKQKTCTLKEFDNTIVFGFGGIHSTRDHGIRFEDVILLDVASLHPSTIINQMILGTATEIFSSIKDERMVVKHSGVDFVLSDALKLFLNSIYGLLKNKYSLLNNPRASATVCIIGQIILYELSKRLSTNSTIIQTNTDGVMFTTECDMWMDIWKDWEKEFNYDLEVEYFDLLIQRDVNNYIAVEKGTGKLTTKGGDVARYESGRPFDNNSIRIVDIAIVDYLVYGVRVIDTIRNNLDKPELFQYILQAGHTFKGIFDEQDNQYNKINRVFGCKEDNANVTTLYKKRKDNGLVKFPNAPDNMIVWNKEVSEIEDFKKIIDLNWYYKLIMNKLESWK